MNVQNQETLDGIAIIGMVGRFPGAVSVEELWKNLCDGVESTTFFTDEELDSSINRVAQKDSNYIKARGVIEDADKFDAAFFGVNPREAEVMDPQQRVFLEMAWAALEDAGYEPEAFEGLIGVYAGMSNNTYFTHNVVPYQDVISQVGEFQVMTANEKDYLATRVSYKLNLKGPSVSIHTACSTSLVAINEAFHSLMSYQCDMALAGGISISVPQNSGYFYQEGAMLSSDGHCRSFDARAAGTVFSNGVGVLVLKRYEDALQAGDHIYAVIRGAAINNDGSDKVSFAAPSVGGQAEAIALAQAYANVHPETISYVETHGTATPLGDPIEIEALTQAFRTQTEAKQFCAIGSIKSNFGHLIAAAGVAGTIKTALALKHKLIPASLHFESPNPRIDFANSPFYVNTKLTEWRAGNTPRRAGVSSFGVGGTNAHVVLEEAPTVEPSSQSRPQHLLLLSAKTQSALDAATANLCQHLTQNIDINLADVAYTLQVGRKGFNYRRFVVCGDRLCAIQALEQLSLGQTATRQLNSRNPEVIFMFPGQGAEYANMGLNLYEHESVFRQSVDRCAEILQPLLGCDLRYVLYSQENDADTAAAFFTQPALFVIEYALAQLWISWGVHPSGMIGHSVGEFVAACLAGVFSLENALMLVATWGRLMPKSGEPFAECVRKVELSPPKIPFVSSVTATWITSEQATDEMYWAQHLQATVRFADGLKEWEQPDCVLLEVGPGTTAATLARTQAKQIVISSLSDTVGNEPPRRGGHRAVNTGEWVVLLNAVGQLWLAGVAICWQEFYANERRLRVPLPTYPFERQRFWLEPKVPQVKHKLGDSMSQSLRQNNLIAQIKEILAETSGLDLVDMSEVTTFLEMGLDSLSLTQVGLMLQRKFGVKVTFRQLLEEFSTLSTLAKLIDEKLPPEVVAAPARQELEIAAHQDITEESTASASVAAIVPLMPQPLPMSATAAHNIQSSGLEHVIAQQLQIMSRQLELLGSPSSALGVLTTNSQAASHPTATTNGSNGNTPTTSTDAKKSFGAAARIDTSERETLTSEQQRHLEKFIQEYTARTKQSKNFTQSHRACLADPRAVSGFNRILKELVYPIVANRSSGSKIWDIDGNEYVDLTNGFGSNFLGYSTQLITEAIATQLQLGFEIAPQTPLAGEVAKLICEFTKLDRVAFCNTGSEAVLGAMRLARTVTGRSTIAIFSGAYHGIFDEVIVRGTKKLQAIPAAPGILPSAVENLLVLDYDSPQSLEILKARAGELAAIMVEPVQSRRPELQPRDFLAELRCITQRSGAAFIIDEVITGFRIHPGGAQAHFGVQADIATYGKVVGGGMPIGVIAGKSAFMDALDGGFWQFGDASFPEVGVTYFAGTFVRHPLALAAAKATLDYLKRGGPQLQQSLNEITNKFVVELNACFSQLQAPFKVNNFGSLFKVTYPHDLPFGELLFYWLRAKGIHIWDHRPCFLTLAHSEEDLEFAIAAFQQSIVEMQVGGFLPQPSGSKGINEKKHSGMMSTNPPIPGARLGRDPNGNPAWYTTDPDRNGKYLAISH